jgi:predicted RNA-binding protein YlqC (UPF0109 family)
MKELLEAIARVLVDHPDQVHVQAIEGIQSIVLELRVDRSDLGKIIGRQGRIIKSVRTIMVAAGMKLHKRITVEVIE